MNACEKDCNKCKACKILHKKPVKTVKRVKPIILMSQPTMMSASPQIGAPPSILQQLLDFQKALPLERMQSSSPMQPPQPYQEVKPLSVSPEYISPNPVIENIVKNPNVIKQMSASPYQGFSINKSVNDLDKGVSEELLATKDFGGMDAYSRFQPPDSPGTVIETSTRYRKPLTDEEIESLEFYSIQKLNKTNRKKFDEDDKQMYNLGKKISTNKATHPEVLQYKLKK